jgi:hypothetical protein
MADCNHVYVSDTSNHRIQVFTKADGAFVRQWGSEGQADGEFLEPHGLSLAVDSDHVLRV